MDKSEKELRDIWGEFNHRCAYLVKERTIPLSEVEPYRKLYEKVRESLVSEAFEGELIKNSLNQLDIESHPSIGDMLWEEIKSFNEGVRRYKMRRRWSKALLDALSLLGFSFHNKRLKAWLGRSSTIAGSIKDLVELSDWGEMLMTLFKEVADILKA